MSANFLQAEDTTSVTYDKKKITATNILRNAQAKRGMDVVSDFADKHMDIFGKLAVAAPFKLFEYSATNPFDTDRYWSISQVGSGTVTRNAATTHIELYTSTASGDEAIMQTRRSIQYNKGNAQEIYLIYKPCAVTNRRERWGYFDGKNGAFFEHDGTVPRLVIRTDTSGSPVDTQIEVSDWNDPLDGTGPSGLTIDWTKQTVFKIEIGWLSSRGVRFSVDVNGTFVTLKSSLISNTLSFPFMRTANLPIRYEVVNTGTVASANTSAMSCCAVQSSGSAVQEGAIRSLSSGVTPLNATTTQAIVAGIRLKSNYLNGAVQPLDFEMLPASGNTYVHYQVIYNPTLTGAVWATPAHGIVDTLTSVTSYTGGSVITEGTFPLSTKTNVASSVLRDLKNDIYVGRGIDDSRDALVITFQTDTSTGTVFFTGRYREYA